MAFFYELKFNYEPDEWYTSAAHFKDLEALKERGAKWLEKRCAQLMEPNSFLTDEQKEEFKAKLAYLPKLVQKALQHIQSCQDTQWHNVRYDDDSNYSISYGPVMFN